jgi:hypothetical protein
VEVERYRRRAEYRCKIDRRADGAGGQIGRQANRHTDWLAEKQRDRDEEAGRQVKE